MKDNEYKISDFDTQENELLGELKKVKYNDLEDLVYRFQITYDEIIDILDLTNIPNKKTGYSLNPSFYEIIVLNDTLKYILPDNVKLSITFDDVRLKSNLKTNQTWKFFLYYTGFYSITFLSSRRYRWILSTDCGIIQKRQTDINHWNW